MDSLSILQRLGTSRFIEELGTTLAEVSEQVVLTRKKGKVSVTFSIAPAPGNEIGVTVAEEIKRTPPVKDSRGAYFFALDGELHEGDPRQPALEFRTVDRTTGEVITVDGSSTVVNVQKAGA
jgi:hypothetical protein